MRKLFVVALAVAAGAMVAALPANGVSRSTSCQAWTKTFDGGPRLGYRMSCRGIEVEVLKVVIRRHVERLDRIPRMRHREQGDRMRCRRLPRPGRGIVCRGTLSAPVVLRGWVNPEGDDPCAVNTRFEFFGGRECHDSPICTDEAYGGVIWDRNPAGC